MLSVTKPFITTPTKLVTPSLYHHHHVKFLMLSRIRSSNNNNTNNMSSNDEENASSTTIPVITPPETVEIRFRRGSKKRRKEQEDGMSMKTQTPPSPPKDWDSMTLTEKALELYVGEKGMLFWLNKFAYASIYIIIGLWILFRFVGPALNLYQLDAPPLSPTAILKG